MKFKVGDKVLVTNGKDKGKKSVITKVMPTAHKVVVEGVNMYTKHMKPFMGRPGEKVRLERPMSTAKISILNDKDQPDRIGYSVDKNGKKVRIFKKTGSIVSTEEVKTSKSTKTKSKK